MSGAATVGRTAVSLQIIRSHSPGDSSVVHAVHPTILLVVAAIRATTDDASHTPGARTMWFGAQSVKKLSRLKVILISFKSVTARI